MKKKKKNNKNANKSRREKVVDEGVEVLTLWCLPRKKKY